MVGYGNGCKGENSCGTTWADSERGSGGGTFADEADGKTGVEPVSHAGWATGDGVRGGMEGDGGKKEEEEDAEEEVAEVA